MTCSFCSGSHNTGTCDLFRAKGVEQRWSHVRSRKLCQRCLNLTCDSTKCWGNKHPCLVCNGEHHTILHRDLSLTAPPFSPALNAMRASTALPLNLMPTAQCKVISQDGNEFIVRALLDSGAQKAFVSSHLAKKLGRPSHFEELGLTLTNAKEPVCKRAIYKMAAGPVCGQELVWFQAIELDHLSTDIVPVQVQRKAWPHHDGLKLADPNFN